jgi:hypothetical protein
LSYILFADMLSGYRLGLAPFYYMVISRKRNYPRKKSFTRQTQGGYWEFGNWPGKFCDIWEQVSLGLAIF